MTPRTFSFYIEVAQSLLDGVEIRDRRYHLRKYRQCFVGFEAVSFLMDKGFAKTSDEAVEIGNRLVKYRCIRHVVDDIPFQNDNLFYRFLTTADGKISILSPSTTEKSLSTVSLEKIDLSQVVEVLKEDLDIRDRKIHFRQYSQCFVGSDAADILLSRGIAQNEDEAVAIGNLLMENRIIRHIDNDYDFQPGMFYYKFIDPKKPLSRRQSSSSVTDETVSAAETQLPENFSDQLNEMLQRVPSNPSDILLKMSADLSVASKFLPLFMVPKMELPNRLTPQVLRDVDNSELFLSLPLVLGTLQTIASESANRSVFIQLMHVLRYRVSLCRGLKLKFLLLLQNDYYKQFWNLNLVYRSDAYENSSLQHEILKQSVSPESKNGTSMPSQSETLEYTRENLLKNSQLLVRFAVTKLLNAQYGVHMKDRKHHFTNYKKTFRAYQAIDWMMVHLGLETREDAIELLDNLRKMKVIVRAGHHTKRFKDGKDLFHGNVEQVSFDQSHSCVVTTSNQRVACWKSMSEESQHVAISRVDMTVSVDMIDLQSMKFWSDSVYSKDVLQNHSFGYLEVTHPLRVLMLGQDDLSVSALSDTLDDECLETELTEDPPTDSRANAMNLSLIASNVVVKKVFSSIAAPMIVQPRQLLDGVVIDGDDCYRNLEPSVITKTGDNLFQDLACELMFHCFNTIWEHLPQFFSRDERPFICTYDVVPCGDLRGIMETVNDIESLKDFDWKKWANEADPSTIDSMVRSAAGAYVGAYVLGVRDRHWDNILIKEGRYLMHIDFGFLMGQMPPVDAPRFSVSGQMQTALMKLQVWDKFLVLCGKAFTGLRVCSPQVIRVATTVFVAAGFDKYLVSKFLRGKFSLNVHADDDAAVRNVVKQVSSSSKAWMTKLKSMFHSNIDPVFYSLLKNHFPPAVLAMKLVDMKRMNSQKSKDGKFTLDDSNSSTIQI